MHFILIPEYYKPTNLKNVDPQVTTNQVQFYNNGLEKKRSNEKTVLICSVRHVIAATKQVAHHTNRGQYQHPIHLNFEAQAGRY